MIADHEEACAPPLRGILLTGVYAGLWLVLVASLAAIAVTGQLRAAKDDFQVYAGGLHREVDQRLRGNESALEGVAAYLRVATDGDAGRPERHVEQLLQRFPQVYQVLVQRRVTHDDVPLLIERMRAEGSGGYRLHRFEYGYPREWSSAAPKPDYYPITYLQPPRSNSAADLGLDISSIEFLHTAMRRALDSGRPAASQVFALPAGELAYLLFHPVLYPDEPGYGDVVAAVIVRGRDLLPENVEWSPGTRLTLRHPGAGSEVLFSARGRSVHAVEHRLLPTLRYEEGFGGGSQPFELVVEKQLGWGALAPPMLMATAAVGVGGLILVILYARVRLRRDEDRRRTAERLYRLANYDSLTGLPNRNLFRDRLDQALSRAVRHKGRVALLFLDLDGFKAVNDTAGHAAGDHLLCEIARRLRDCVRGQDTVARLSGDEFVIVLEDVGERSDAERVIEQLHACFDESVGIDDNDFLVTASIGLALYPDDGRLPEELLRKADHAMYRKKHPNWMAPIAS